MTKLCQTCWRVESTLNSNVISDCEKIFQESKLSAWSALSKNRHTTSVSTLVQSFDFEINEVQWKVYQNMKWNSNEMCLLGHHFDLRIPPTASAKRQKQLIFFADLAFSWTKRVATSWFSVLWDIPAITVLHFVFRPLNEAVLVRAIRLTICPDSRATCVVKVVHLYSLETISSTACSNFAMSLNSCQSLKSQHVNQDIRESFFCTREQTFRNGYSPATELKFWHKCFVFLLNFKWYVRFWSQPGCWK